MYEAGVTLQRACGMDVEDVCRALRVTYVRENEHLGTMGAVAGLTAAEASQRRALHGSNELHHEEEDPLWKRFLGQFNDPMIGLLGVSALISVIVGSYDDAISISLAVVIVTIVAFVQEYRSDQSLAALSELAPPQCDVFRNGQLNRVATSELVVGDLVELKAGDRVPADLRISMAVQLTIDESTLTGETTPAKKKVELIAGPATELADRRNCAFMGTSVTAGRGAGIVVAVGDNTEFGSVFSLMRDSSETRTPLQQAMDSLGKRLSIVSLAIISVIALVGWIAGKPLMEMFTIGVSLAVAAIPEGLPIVVTVTLALGVMRMAEKNAVVKKLPAVEALGCANVVCVDKTGTLTTNEMTVVQMYSPAEAELVVVGAGDSGGAAVAGVPVTRESHPHVALMMEIGSVCNNADWGAKSGQPTELALLVAAEKLRSRISRSDVACSLEIPFASETKWMAVRGRVVAGTGSLTKVYRPSGTGSTGHGDLGAGMGREADSQPVAGEAYFVKGTLENVLRQCATYVAGSDLAEAPLDEAARTRIEDAAAGLGANGLRVLALASGPSREAGLCFAGVVGMQDPLRASTRPAIDYLRASGVAVSMITGDGQATACNIALQAGILTTDELAERPNISMSGQEIETATEEHLATRIHAVRVFYRAAPRHKMAIVKAYQRRGDVVAMTGDGVNDAPALKVAQIGVALGRAGTGVCKEAADMILMDDDVSTILHAIEEGKSLFYNIRHFVRFQISTSIAALFLVAYSTVAGKPNPLNAMQILWINILMDGPPAQSLGVEPVDLDVMRQPPRPAKEPIITRHLMKLILMSACFIVAGTEFVFLREMADNVVTRRDTTMTFTTFVMFDLFTALTCRSSTKSIFQIGLFSNKFFLIAVGGSLIGQLAVIYAPPLQAVFQTEAIYAKDWALILALSSTVLIADEIRKFVERRRAEARPRRSRRGFERPTAAELALRPMGGAGAGAGAGGAVLTSPSTPGQQRLAAMMGHGAPGSDKAPGDGAHDTDVLLPASVA